eukprot:gnl/TRDRNA2_/TRDRNA2_177154_c0_seq1.p1 gnl/TRDRNA2_/TRDRNA2_177154_c0~~gnl/TRDRNA2_/TRDRNA2_177154_c0_seq1.p1  ORF type:complete len:608 (-),score=138.57 gnl/TRDRNA2_/TRDRNA2_177154_c0_seq1:338-2053(-)
MAASPANNRTSGEKADAPVRPTKLFIGGLSRRTTTKQLRDHFSKYGRILDCIAMRQPDGRPRGFGYVTLDSPAAAEMCLREPQNIDDRIVDLKPAVPDGSSDKSGMTSMLSPQSYHFDMSLMDASLHCGDSMGHLTLPTIGSHHMSDSSWWWHEQQALASQVDCLDVLRGGFGAPMPPTPTSSGLGLDCVNLLTHQRQMEMEIMAGMHGAYPDLSLPMATPVMEKSGPMLGTNPPAPPAAPPQQPPPLLATKAPVPLSDVTNLIDNRAAAGTKPLCAASEEFVQTSVNAKAPTTLPPGRVAPELPPGLVVPQPQQSALTLTRLAEKAPTQLSFIDEEDKSPMKADIITPATTAGGSADIPSTISSAASTPLAQSEDPASPAMCESADPLPSIGSAQHASGECRRCNFFAKGRCKNGKECCFCHLPHDRKKLSRQERRDQKAAFLAQQGNELGSDNDEDAEGDKNGDMVKHSLSIITPKRQTSQTMAGVRSPPGLAPPPGLEPQPQFAMAQSSKKSPVMCTIGTQTTCEMGTQTDESDICQRCEDSNAADEEGEDREATASSPTSAGALYAV